MNRDWSRVPLLHKPQDGPLHEIVALWSAAQARPCLCGGTVLANVIDPSEGVRVHQQTAQHREWSARVYG